MDPNNAGRTTTVVPIAAFRPQVPRLGFETHLGGNGVRVVEPEAQTPPAPFRRTTREAATKALPVPIAPVEKAESAIDAQPDRAP